MMLWPVLQAAILASAWQCVGAHVAILDIGKAFNFMQHGSIAQLLLRMGLDYGMG